MLMDVNHSISASLHNGAILLYVMLNFTSTSSLLVELIRMEFCDIATELRQRRGAHVRHS